MDGTCAEKLYAPPVGYVFEGVCIMVPLFLQLLEVSLFCLLQYGRFYFYHGFGLVLFCFLSVLMATKKPGFSGMVCHFALYYFFFFFTDSSIPRGTGLFLVLIRGLCFEFGSFFFLSESEHCYYPLPRACTSPLL